MSAYYGVSEGDEITLNGVTKTAPVVEPVDDPRFLFSASPDRDFGPRQSTRFTRSYGAPKRAPFSGVDFEAMLS